MIEYLHNIYFYLSAVITYLILVLIWLNYLGVVDYIRRVGSRIIIKYGLNGEHWAQRLFILLKSLSGVFAKLPYKLGSFILVSFGKFVIRSLKIISINLNTFELKGSRELSILSAEVFTFIGLIIRKAIEDEVQVVWSVSLLFTVLIYFILTII